jgi:energy-coupling factor transporter transmembrane protein EcfT
MMTANSSYNNFSLIACGIFFILVIEKLTDIALFCSKVISTYFLNDIFLTLYVFFLLFLFIVWAEIVFFIKKLKLTQVKNLLKKLVILLLFLFVINSFSIYLEGSIVTVYIGNKYEEAGLSYINGLNRYAGIFYTLHNLCFTLFTLFNLKKFNQPQELQ